MKQLQATLMVAMLAIGSLVRADEGMWLIHMLERIAAAEMNRAGLNLTAEEIYDINNASLKDAIVRLNGGMCTGEIISSQGLVLTNHHCAYDAIQGFSAPEHDYLTDGFFALSLKEEKHIEDFEISFLVRVDDVTDQMLANVTDDMSEADRAAAIQEARAVVLAGLDPEDSKEIEIKSFYYGSEFYAFEYKTYMDVRLVAAPPESVGKYGGDTDNWMWPRHTGDFSMLRIYAGSDNEPAEFSEANVPLTPKHHLKVNTAGVAPGDFTMVMGYPGSTDRYLSSYGVRQALETYNPSVVAVRDLKLRTMKEHMDADLGVRIQYAAKYAQTANYWKYYIGQSKGLTRLEIEQQKKALEDQFTAWVNADPARQAKYGEALSLIQSYYAETDATVKGDVYALEAGLIGADLPLFVVRFSRMAPGLFSENAEEVEATRAMLTDLVQNHFKEYNQATDRDVFVRLMTKYMNDVAADQQPSFFSTVKSKYKGDFEAFAAKMYAKSFLVDEASCMAFLAKPSQKTMDKDMAVVVGRSLLEQYLSSMNGGAQESFDRGYRLFVEGLREMQPNKLFYPDANSTMRVTFGHVGAYDPADAVHYDYFTTANGIMEKKDNSNPEFVVPAKLEELIRNRDFGRWADTDGELRVCFIHGTDITGGNSGSPVIDGNGNIIGLAFDGNWEAMSGDITFEEELQRTISVDIRYVMWVIDKFAGAQNLIDEMDFVSEPGRGKRPDERGRKPKEENDNSNDGEQESKDEKTFGDTSKEKSNRGSRSEDGKSEGSREEAEAKRAARQSKSPMTPEQRAEREQDREKKKEEERKNRDDKDQE